MTSRTVAPAFAVALLSTFASDAGFGQLAELVAELEQGHYDVQAHSDPHSFSAREGEAFFLAREINGATLLWRTDGTREGTQAVFAGATGILGLDDDDLFFLRETELWWTNGRTDGRADHRFLGDVNLVASEARFTAEGSSILFLNHRNGASEILRADKFMMTTLETTARALNNAWIQSTLAFFDSEGKGWRSDGTEAGTFSFGQPPHPVGTQGRVLTATDTHIYWVAQVESELQLWRSNGSASGTHRIDLSALNITLASDQLKVQWERVFFLGLKGVQNLWFIRDADQQPTQATHFDRPEAIRYSNGDPSYLRSTQDGLFFLADDANEDTYIWFSRWGQPDAQRILFLCRNCTGNLGVFLHTEGPGVLFKVSGSPSSLWFSDGTGAGTRRVLTCDRGCGSFIEGVGFALSHHPSNDEPLALITVSARNGEVEVLAENPPIYEGPVGGVLLGTRLLTVGETGFLREPVFIDLASGQSGDLGDLAHAYRSPPALKSSEDEHVFFTYRVGRPAQLRLGETNGTQAGTQLLGDMQMDCRLSYPCIKVGPSIFNGHAFLDLETGQTTRIPDLYSNLNQLAKLSNERFVFYASRESELWSTDATPSGTTLLQKGVGGFFVFDEDSYVTAVQEGRNWEYLLHTDGTQSGTSLFRVSDLDFDYRRVALSRSWIYLGTSSTLIRVSRTDGRVEDLTGDLPAFEPFRIASAGTAIELFLGRDTRADRYRLDDDSRVFRFQNPVSTQVSRRMRYQFDAVRIPGKTLVSTGDYLIELGDDGSYSEHQQLVSEKPVVVASAAYFASSGLNRGTELWSISTTSGPQLVHDIWPGPRSSNPSQLLVADNRLFFTADDGLHGPEIWALDTRREGCLPTQFSLCLQNNRFKVDTWWSSFDDTTGRGRAVPITADTGAFWFFEPTNLEAVVKTLDGRTINDFFWTFFGSLSNVEFAITVSDSASGATRRYRNRSGSFASVGDVTSLSGEPSELGLLEETLKGSRSTPTPRSLHLGSPGACRTGPSYLCLRDGDFEVSVNWQDFDSGSGEGVARSLVSDTGAFWFFDSENLELAIKVLDGGSVNAHFWVFFASLSNVPFVVEVRETATGRTREYVNPPGNFASVGDVVAFTQDLD